jgi:hypothetical protein
MKILKLSKKMCIALLIGLLVVSSIITNSYAQSDSEIVPMATGAINLKGLNYGDTITKQLGWLNKGDIVSITSSSWYPNSVRLVCMLNKQNGNGEGYTTNSGDTRSFTVPEDGFYEFTVANFSVTQTTILNGNISLNY